MPRRASEQWRRVAEVSDAQVGLITSAQLDAIGVPRRTRSERTRTGGPWARLLPGVYLLTGGRPDREQQRMAAILFAGTGSALTGLDALHLHGVERHAPAPTHPVHVLTPHSRQRRSTGFVLVERTRREPGSVERSGLATAPPARATVDHARRLVKRGDVMALVGRVVQGGHASIGDLDAELRSAHRRSTGLLREVMADLRAGTRSAPEAELRRAWLESGLPEPRWNPRLYLPDGRFLACPDAYVEEVGLAVEVDSVEFHFSPADWQATMQRHARMTAAGLVVIHVPPSRIRERPREVVREVSRAIEANRGRTPNVRINQPELGGIWAP